MDVINRNSFSEGLIKIVVVPLTDDWDDIEYYIFIRELPKNTADFVKII